jgi:hypothetical protein
MSAMAHPGRARSRTSSRHLAVRLVAELLIGGLVIFGVVEGAIGVIVARGLDSAVAQAAGAAARAPGAARSTIALTQLADNISPRTHGEVTSPCASAALQCSVSQPQTCPPSEQGSTCVTVSVSYDYDQAKHFFPDLLGLYPTFHASRTVAVGSG